MINLEYDYHFSVEISFPTFMYMQYIQSSQKAHVPLYCYDV